jgi:hypothetical protein
MVEPSMIQLSRGVAVTEALHVVSGDPAALSPT